MRDRFDGAPRRLRRGDVAFLCRRRDTCSSVADRLAALGLDAEVTRFGLLATVEGRAVSAGLRLWVDPADVLARAELMRLLEPGGVALDTLLAPERLRAAPLPSACEALLTRRDREPFAGGVDAFDHVVASLELGDALARWGRGRRAVANLDALRAHAVGFARLARPRLPRPSLAARSSPPMPRRRSR